jgi:hypothetical protein
MQAFTKLALGNSMANFLSQELLKVKIEPETEQFNS